MRRLVCLVAVLVTAATAVSRAAETADLASEPVQALYGVVTGIVTDARGMPMSGATVTITHTGNGLKRETTTNSAGEYDIVNVQPATYDVRVTKGTTVFTSSNVKVPAGAIVRVNFRSAEGTTGDRNYQALIVASSTSEELQAQIVFSTYRAGRADGSAASGGADTFSSYLSASSGLCDLSAGREPGSAGFSPAVSWRVSGRVVNRTDRELTVHLEWERLWENGQRLAKPRTGLLEATIRVGERFPLDSVTSPVTTNCGVTSGRLEATVVSRPATARGGGGARAGGFGSASAGGGGGRSSGGDSAGAGTGAPPAGALPGSAGGGGGRKSGSATFGGGAFEGSGAGTALGSGTAVERAEEMAARLREMAAGQPSVGPLFEAELWLVHTLPDGSERPELIRQPLRESTSFVFPSLRVVVQSVPIDIEVFGFVRRLVGEGGVPSLQIAIGQRQQRGSRPEDGQSNYSGNGKVVSWPTPNEVLSFELSEAGRLIKGHRFDLRLRITPR